MEKMEENLTKLFRNLSENEFKMKILQSNENNLHHLKYNTSTFALDEPFLNNLN